MTLLALASIAVVGLVGTAVLLGQTGPGDGGSSGAQVATPVPARPVPSSSIAPNRPVIQIPATIDATGGSDVTAALQAIIDEAPDGSILRMTPGGRYRVDGTLAVLERHNLEWDGAGATIEATLVVDTPREHVLLKGSTSIRIHDVTIRGANPEPGVLDERHQFEHGIKIEGGADIEISSVTVDSPRGDCIYVALGNGLWAERIRIQDSACEGAGRNGIGIVAGRDVRIEGNTFRNIGLHVVDIEPNQPANASDPVQGAERVSVVRNRALGPVGGYFFAANGWGAVGDLAVTDNVLEGVALRVTVQPRDGSGYIRERILVRGNRSDTAFETDGGAAMRFTRNVNLSVADNVGPLAGPGASFIEIRDSCRISIGGNSFPGGQFEVIGEPGTCPVVSGRTSVLIGDGR